jgi:hypothetical protein
MKIPIKCSGVTFVEIGTVIVIFGFLCALVVPKFKSAKTRMVQQESVVNAENIEGSKLKEITGANRLKMTGKYGLEAFGPTIYIVFDSTTNNELMIVIGTQAIAMTILPRHEGRLAGDTAASSYVPWKVPQ